MIKNIRLFINDNKESIKLGKVVRTNFIKNGFNITDDEFDLGIAISGDGSFLKMIRSTNFDSKPYYVGINSGTLGFLQEVKKDEVDKLIQELIDKKYKVDEIGIQETEIYTNDNVTKLYTLNEIVVRDEQLKMLKLAIYIDEDLLEYYTGDGILIASSQGSTAHNLSYGGSIIYNTFSSLQLTPIGPINSKVYKTLNNSVIIPTHKEIIIEPNGIRKNLIVTFDGNNYTYEDVKQIKTSIKDKKIKCLRFSHYNFPQKINEKLLSNKN